MTIYKITNTLNNKVYIGRTTRDDVTIRWREHKKLYKNAKNTCIYLYNAFRKDGIENFKFEVIEENIIDKHILAERESYYIQKLNTLSPNGYNLEFFHGVRVRSQESSDRMSCSTQGKFIKNKKSKYIGVKTYRYKDKTFYLFRIQRLSQNYSSSCDNEEVAAESYDKLALYLYGDLAKINFPEKMNIYKSNNLSIFFENICLKHKTSKYDGVFFAKRCNRWLSQIRENGKVIRTFNFKEERLAAENQDMAKVFFNKDLDKLNFPEKLEEYRNRDLEKVFVGNKIRSKYKYITFVKKINKWSANCMIDKKRYFCGCWESEIRAAEEADKQIYLITKRTNKLNFPEKIKLYETQEVYSDTRARKRGFIGIKNGYKGFNAIIQHNFIVYTSIRAFKSREEAATVYDIFVTLNNIIGKKLNFPEKLDEYRKIKLEDFEKFKKYVKN